MGPSHGGACPRTFRVDPKSARAYATLDELHLDHEQDLVVTCDKWDDGVDGAFLRGGDAARYQLQPYTTSLTRCST